MTSVALNSAGFSFYAYKHCENSFSLVLGGHKHIVSQA